MTKTVRYFTQYIKAICCLLVFVCMSLTASADGGSMPLFRNFPASEYKAHNRSFDIVCDDYGSVFIANFEGLLYFDGASWRKIHTPGISRVTSLARDTNGRIWFGGYNVFGYLKPDAQGRLQMQTVVSDASKGGLGEVDKIKEVSKTIYIHTTNDKSYFLAKDQKLKPLANNEKIFTAADSFSALRLPNGCKVEFSHFKGISFSNTYGEEAWQSLSETEGLISNTVNDIAFNNGNFVWGATDKGLFCIEAVSPYSILNEHTGLKGEVNCITKCDNILYFGTMEGLYCMMGNNMQRIGNLDLACWQFATTRSNTLYAATSIGLYKINGQSATHLSDGNTLSVCVDAEGKGCYTGEFDGIYYTTDNGVRKQISQIEKATHIMLQGSKLTAQSSNSQDGEAYIIAETIYGEQWKISLTKGTEQCLRTKIDINEAKIDYTDPFGTRWTTDNNGRNLKTNSKNNYAKVLEPWTNPFRQKTLNALYVSDHGDVWIGGDFGAYSLTGKSLNSIDKGKVQTPYIREVIINGDSVIWGGYDSDMKPRSSITGIEIPSSCNHIAVLFSPKGMSFIKPTLYRHRINGGRWSSWTENTSVEFNNPFYGKTLVEVQAMDLFGRLSNAGNIEWYKQFPLYLRWWALLAYLIIFIYGTTIFFRWRTNRLTKDKEKLEGIVAERTSELSAAYNEQQKISAELSDTLEDLKRTQDDLVRMERTATAGKLTQGLIDRILNPINYINNFSKLTSGLAKDLQEDIEDEKENMSQDNYEDCEDILDMMSNNLQKIEEHGINTTRTLRAMEAMLNNRIGALVSQDMRPLCRQAVAVAAEHFKEDIARYGISIRTDMPEMPVMVSMDAEAMNKVLLSLITNSVYAVAKKFSQAAYDNPEIVLKVTLTDTNARICIHDNGIGIEDTIKGKVFDPFFTTKPTGEAAGVGLYLVREIVNGHKGTITVKSEKGEYCDFTILIQNA